VRRKTRRRVQMNRTSDNNVTKVFTMVVFDWSMTYVFFKGLSKIVRARGVAHGGLSSLVVLEIRMGKQFDVRCFGD
jgi:hypothetical protein